MCIRDSFRVILKIPRLGNNPAFAKIALYLLREHPIRWTVFANNPCPEKVDSYEEFEKIYEKERFNQVHKIFSMYQLEDDDFKDADHYWKRYCLLTEPRGKPVPMFSQCCTNRVEGTNFVAINNGIRKLPPVQALEGFMKMSKATCLKYRDTVSRMSCIHRQGVWKYTTVGLRISKRPRDPWTATEVEVNGNVVTIKLWHAENRKSRELHIVRDAETKGGLRLRCPCNFRTQMQGLCGCIRFAFEICQELTREDAEKEPFFKGITAFSNKGASLQTTMHPAYVVSSYIKCLSLIHI